MAGTLSFDLNILASTLITGSPLQVKAPVGPGKIIEIAVQFPPGCQYLAKLQVNVGAPGNPHFPILPSQISGNDALKYIALDSTTGAQKFAMSVKLTQQTYLYLWGWNDDTANAHELKVIVTLE